MLRKIGDSFLKAVITVMLLRFFFWLSFLLGPLSIVLLPLHLVAIFLIKSPIYSLFIVALVVFILSHLTNNFRIRKVINNNKYSYLGYVLLLFYIVWFAFVVSFNPSKLNSLNCLIYPCETVETTDIMKETVLTVLGLDFSKESKLQSEVYDEGSITDCGSIADDLDRGRCLNNKMHNITNPKDCFEINNLNLNHYENRLSTNEIVCLINIVRRNDDVEICEITGELIEVHGYSKSNIQEEIDECYYRVVSYSSVIMDDNLSYENRFKACGFISDIERRNHCYKALSRVTEEISVCELISDNTEKQDCRDDCLNYEWCK